MKKIIALVLAVLMLLSIVACSKTDSNPTDNKTDASTVKPTEPKRDFDASDPAAVLEEITNDFEAVTTTLTQKLEETFTAVGSTYEDYQANKALVDEWVAFVLSETDALFARTKENSILYFKLIAEHPDHKYSEFCDEELEKYYDAVYDEAMDSYYDAIYDDAMDDLYDEYYDGIIDDAYEDVEYEEWSSASSECYKTWSEASSAIYKKWSNGSSYFYGLWSAMNSAFCWNDNFDVDAIFADYDAKKAEEEKKQAEEDAKVYTEFDVVYEIIDDRTAAVTGYTGEGNQITISSTYENRDVVLIAESAFENCTMLESIIMWADIEEIGDSAFKGCTGLTEFSVGSDTTMIGHHAFEGCTNLETLIIWGDPDIGEYAFANCVGLTEISIGSDTKNVGAHAFEGCTGVTSLIIWGVEIVGDYAFAGCTNIEDISIPSDVLSIGNHAFDGCSALSSVIIWDDDTAIGKDAFANCPNLSDAPTARGNVLDCTWSNSNSGNDSNKETESTTPEQGTTTTDGLRPEFKEAMDSYEAFYDEYCDFMVKYKANPTDMKLITEYGDMLIKLSQMQEAFDAWEDEDLNDAELKYYLEVTNRITQKLIDIA